MAAIFFKCSVSDAQKAVKEVIEAMPRTRIARDEPGLLHAEFTSKIFGFVDDVELVFDEEEGRIDFRSASRVGYYDFGANRKRMGLIRQSMKQHPDFLTP
jgi:uncharacterized protein (DUF1499 family)